MNWSGIKAADIDDVWEYISPEVAKGLSEFDTLEGVRKALKNELAQLWVGWQGQRERIAVITQITDYDRGRVLLIRHCGGNGLEHLIEHYDVLEDYARAHDCTHIDIVGRDGWGRLLPDYEKAATTWRKAL